MTATQGEPLKKIGDNMHYYYLYSNLPKPLTKIIDKQSSLIYKLKNELLPLKDYSYVHVYMKDLDKFIYHKTEKI